MRTPLRMVEPGSLTSRILATLISLWIREALSCASLIAAEELVISQVWEGIIATYQ